MVQEHHKYEDFDELVFENRNKAYGAYDLRRYYKGALTKATLIGVSLFLAAIVLPFVYMTATSGGTKEEEIGVQIDMTPELVQEEEEVKEEEKEEIFEEEEQLQSLKDLAPPADTPPVATITNVELEVKEDAKNETPPPTKDEMEGKAISTKTQEGEKAVNNAPPPVQGVEGGKGTDEKIEGTKVVEDRVDTKVIHESVDVEADFSSGGVEGFRKRVQENFDIEAVEGEGTLNTTVSFVVEPDGSISQVKASGSNSDFNREAERVIKSIRTKWNPATIKGQKVRSRFRFPLKMRFEG